MSSLSVDWLEALLTAAAVAVLFFYHIYLVAVLQRLDHLSPSFLITSELEAR
jgi:hypothetical protein